MCLLKLLMIQSRVLFPSLYFPARNACKCTYQLQWKRVYQEYELSHISRLLDCHFLYHSLSQSGVSVLLIYGPSRLYPNFA